MQKFISNDNGATSLEYAIIASLISIVIIAVVAGIGSSVQEKFEAVNDQI